MPSLESMEQRLNDFINRDVPGLPIPATDDNIELAKVFALRKWRERTQQQNTLYSALSDLPDKPLPEDLTDACKFCSMFALKVFGGTMQGNYDHQWSVTEQDEVIDLTDSGQHPDHFYYYCHDDDFWLNEDHVDALESCIDRVNDWFASFVEELPRT